jgi:predicted deacylase
MATEKRPSRLIAEVDFEKDGVQHGFVRLFHSTHASAYGYLPIPIVVVKNGSGPTALFVSGNHGDEYEGQVALCNLAKSLDPSRIRGRVIMLPMANFPAALAGRRVSPIDDLNLNRIFPGDPDGTPTEQIAWFISTVLIPKADLVCDLHSGGSSLMYTPCALIKQSSDPGVFERQQAALHAFGAPLAYIQGSAQGQGGDQTLGSVAEGMGKVAMGTELGGSGTLTPAALRIAERGLNNLLVHLGILPENARIAPEDRTRVFRVGGQDHMVYAPENGVYEPLVEIGDTVKAGQPAARMHFPETPWAKPVETAFLRDGYVLAKRLPGRSMRGDCLFFLGSEPTA